MAKADLLLKLSYMKDERTSQKEEVGGRIRFFFNTLTTKLSGFFQTNLLYVLIFCLPIIFLVAILPSLLESKVMAGYSFAGNFGIGYPGNSVAESVAVNELYSWYYKLVAPLVCPAVFLAVFGLSGVSHCCRGFMWNEKVKPRVSFFRGIKYLWKPYLILAFVLSILATGLGYAFVWQIHLLALGATTAGSWVVFILALLVTLYVVSLLIILIPTLSCYRFTFKEALKNTFILNSVYWLQTLMLAILVVGIFALMATSSGIRILICIMFAVIGFAAMIAAWTTWGQSLFEVTIAQLYSSKENGATITVQKRTKGQAQQNTQNPKAKNARPQNARPQKPQRNQKNQGSSQPPEYSRTYGQTTSTQNNKKKR